MANADRAKENEYRRHRYATNPEYRAAILERCKVRSKAIYRNPTLKAKRAAYDKKRNANPATKKRRNAWRTVKRQGGYRESVVENRLVEQCEARGCVVRKIIYPGRRGCPDRLVITPGGQAFFVELKRPVGGVLSIHQKDEHALYVANNCPVAVLWSIEEVDAWIRKVCK